MWPVFGRKKSYANELKKSLILKFSNTDSCNLFINRKVTFELEFILRDFLVADSNDETEHIVEKLSSFWTHMSRN